jgi:predicted RNA binding protein with dsRBD fold (UPF0201 family)
MIHRVDTERLLRPECSLRSLSLSEFLERFDLHDAIRYVSRDQNEPSNNINVYIKKQMAMVKF